MTRRTSSRGHLPRRLRVPSGPVTVQAHDARPDHRLHVVEHAEVVRSQPDGEPTAMVPSALVVVDREAPSPSTNPSFTHPALLLLLLEADPTEGDPVYSYAETNVAPRNQRQIEPILVRLMKDRSEVTAPLFVRRVQAAPLPGRPLHAADGVRHQRLAARPDAPPGAARGRGAGLARPDADRPLPAARKVRAPGLRR